MGASVRESRWVPSVSRLPDGVVTAAHPTDAGIDVTFTDGLRHVPARLVA